MFKEILGDTYFLLEKLSPTIASALGSPIAGIATDFALQVLGSFFNLKDVPLSQMGNAIVNNPDHETLLQNAEKLFSKTMNSGLQFKMPSEININVKWSDANTQ